MLGRHCLKHWSSTQPSTALSSGEAEFYGVVRGSGHGLGFQALLRDLGIDAKLRLWTDSSAALGICSRQGLGKLRHLDTHTLWVQQAVRSGRIDLKKIKGDENPADLLTKHNQTQDRVEKLVSLFDCYFKSGRAETAPSLRTGQSDKRTLGKAEKEAAMKPLLASMATAGEPHMPHNCVGREKLDSLYPSLEAVPDVPLHDLVKLEDDALYAAGMKVVQQILEDMAAVGRTKRPPTKSSSEDIVLGLVTAGSLDLNYTGWTDRSLGPCILNSGILVQRPPCPPRCGGVWKSGRLRQLAASKLEPVEPECTDERRTLSHMSHACLTRLSRSVFLFPTAIPRSVVTPAQ